MAFAFGFPQDVTDLIYSMRDWRWEMVRDGGKAPTVRCFNIGASYRGNPKLIWVPIRMPHYRLEEDSDDPYDTETERDDSRRRIRFQSYVATFDQFYPSSFLHLRYEFVGNYPAIFSRLQKHNDRRIKEMWFQCEPCERVR